MILAVKMTLMKFALLLAVTFCLIFAFTWLLIFCRRRLKDSRHGVTGICHHQGGPICGNCAEKSGKEDGTRTAPQHETLPPD